MTMKVEERKLSKILPALSEVKIEYQLSLENKLNLVKEKVEEYFPNKSFALECTLSVRAQLEIKGLTQPFTLFVIAPPSSKKTSILELTRATGKCYLSDKFTPRSFVSHSANTTREKLEKVDLLPRIKHKLLISPELSSLFSGDKYEIESNFRLLTRILDGKGLRTDSGVHGWRGYEGDYSFMWLGAIVKIPPKIWNLFGNLGSRIFFYRLPKENISPEEKKKQLKQELKGDAYDEIISECKEKVEEYWKLIETQINPTDERIIWNKKLDDEHALDAINDLAFLLSRLRASIPTKETEQTGGTNYGFEEPVIEDPSRINSSLYGLARGHAVLCGRNYITKDDLYVVTAIVMSSAPEKRVQSFRKLIKNNGELNTHLIGKTPPTALKDMQEFKMLGIVESTKHEGVTKPFLGIRLKPEFSWFLSEEFREYNSVSRSRTP